MTTATPTIQPPPLDIDSYYLNELVFRAFDEYDESRASAGGFGVDFDVQRDANDRHAFRIIMRVNFASDGYIPEANPAYGISLMIVGDFSFANGTDEDLMQRMVRINGSSILYGIARGIVGQATGASKHGQFVLPTVNFVEIVKAKAAAIAAEERRQLGDGSTDDVSAETVEAEHT
jgi:preprotein translocase subunit SecB